MHSRHGALFDLSLTRPPGYPAFVAAVYGVTGRNVTHVILVQLVLSVATVALAYALARRVAGERAAVVSAFVLAVDPISVVMSSNLTTETLFATVWVLAALLWVRGLQERSVATVAATGLVVGLSVLVRPVALYVPILLVPLTYAFAAGARARRLATAAALLLAFAVPVGLWLARNAAETGVATVSTIESHNLLDYRAAEAVAVDTGVSRADAARRLDAEAAARAGRDANAAQVAQEAGKLAWSTLAHHPKGTLVSEVEGAGRVLFGPGRAELLRLVRGYTSPSGVGDRLMIAIEAAILAVVLALALAGAVVAVRTRAVVLLWVTVAFGVYDVVLSAGAEGNARLRMPAMPLAALLAGAGAIALVRRRAARRRP